MYFYRITKYNPKFRDSQDIYLREEWTSFYDVNNYYGKEKFTIEEYLETEKSYIEAIFMIMSLNEVKCLEVKELESYFTEKEILKDDSYLEDEDIEVFRKVNNNKLIYISNIKSLIKLILRNHLWCKLDNSNRMFIHFGHEYYMYIGSLISIKDIIEKINKSGLYVEEEQSPYL